MACKTSYDLHHNFPRLAEETGFAFNTHRPRVHIDWNKIRLIDIESLARDRKFVLIEQHVNDILDCVLESEFDVRILDEGVVKLFRLAQLAVEYQQFCRHYLDRSVFVLRQEIDTLAQDLAVTKKELQEKEEELRRLRKKGRHNYRPLLPYGNENIATMILKTLANKGDMFPSTANGEVPQYNKCNFCNKVFLNQLYLKSHISRRHVDMVDELPQRDVKENGESEVSKVGHETNKLHEEINELKLKIKSMEMFITNNNKVSNGIEKTNITKNIVANKEMKDVEVSTNNDDVFQKLEEWKKSEQENHTKEINLLKNQIFETLNSFKVNDSKKSEEGELKVIEQLHTTIREQGAEILALKQALTHTKLKSDAEDKERRKEIEEQMVLWEKRDMAQSKQYELLMQKLNEVAKEASASRALAEAEAERARKLATLLKERENFRNEEANKSSGSDELSSSIDKNSETDKHSQAIAHNKSKPAVDHVTLEKLHRKAQELLNMKSSSSSDTSTAEQIIDLPTVTVTKNSPVHTKSKKRGNKTNLLQIEDKSTSKKINKVSHKTKSLGKLGNTKTANNKGKRIKKEQLEPAPSISIAKENGPILSPGSPVKVVRAKITEEVNSRLVQAGVDPLKSRLHRNVFQKQKSELQRQLELKSKKYPAYEQVRYTIMAYLDSDASGIRRQNDFEQNFAVPNASKAFSLGSMISNVKNKALSIVKSKEMKRKGGNSPLNTENAKKAPSLLKTSLGSPVSPNIRHSSPAQHEKLNLISRHDSVSVSKEDKNIKNRSHKNKDSTPSLVDGVDSDSNDSNNSHNIPIPQRPSRSIDNLIKSPAKRPSSATADFSNTVLKYAIRNERNDPLIRTQSVTNFSEFTSDQRGANDDPVSTERTIASNDDIHSLLNDDNFPKSEDGQGNSLKQTKGVLKNASSISSLNKKKVIFDMDAIQMKSVSASPSQSLTEKSDDKYELGLVNIGDDEWDISSIENEPIKNDTKLRVGPGQSLKIAELKQTIEAQLARRSETPSTALFGGVDVLRGPIAKSVTVGGSNTSLGSSILDESDSSKIVNQKTLVKPKKIAEKDDSELDISDFSIDGDGVTNKHERDSF